MTNRNLGDLRKSYEKGELSEEQAGTNPFELFDKWFNDEKEAENPEPNAMVLSTVNGNKPSSRVVLLKELNNSQFVFFTNYNSKKGQELKLNNNANLTFWWHQTQRQVRIEGRVIQVDKNVSDEYFQSRPLGSKLGALASNQSQKIDNRDVIENKLVDLEKQYSNILVPRPSEWGGYGLIPEYFEFWQGRQNRLHDRIVFEKDLSDNWKIYRLSP